MVDLETHSSFTHIGPIMGSVYIIFILFFNTNLDSWGVLRPYLMDLIAISHDYLASGKP